MSFAQPQAPPPMVLPQAPQPAQGMLPAGQKPGRKAPQPTMIGEALAPTSGQEGARSLVGSALGG